MGRFAESTIRAVGVSTCIGADWSRFLERDTSVVSNRVCAKSAISIANRMASKNSACRASISAGRRRKGEVPVIIKWPPLPRPRSCTEDRRFGRVLSSSFGRCSVGHGKSEKSSFALSYAFAAFFFVDNAAQPCGQSAPAIAASSGGRAATERTRGATSPLRRRMSFAIRPRRTETEVVRFRSTLANGSSPFLSGKLPGLAEVVRLLYLPAQRPTGVGRIPKRAQCAPCKRG